jgi:hypothetical protein
MWVRPTRQNERRLPSQINSDWCGATTRLRTNLVFASVDKGTPAKLEATMHGLVDVAIICGWVVAVYAIARHYWR